MVEEQQNTNVQVSQPVAQATGDGQAKQVPGLVKAISVLYYIGVGVILLMGLLLLIAAGSIMALFAVFGGQINNLVMVIIQVVILGLAVFQFFLARGLWRGQNWARMFVIVLSILGVIGGIVAIVLGNFTAVTAVLLEGALAGYLLFSKKVKEAFA